ncbi:MAG: LysR family transcriptional regulator [Rhizobiaceae bacterium]|nr:LysR family transcriptional regulator [Rhizobiaceae bacterium]
MAKAAEAKLSFRAIEVFACVVEEQGVTPAAKRLGASPSAVSLQLSNLENVLGVKLIERSAQRFALTSAGELFHPRALRILDEISSASAALSKSTVSPRMTLKIAVIEDFDSMVISPWLMAIRSQYPNIRFNMRSGPSHESHDALSTRSADIIVAVEAMESADWVEEHSLLNDPYILVKSDKAKRATSLEDLSKLPFIRYSREQLMGRQVEAHLRRNKFIPTRENEFSSNQMVFAMVEAQGGWTITSMAAFASAYTSGGTLQAAELPFPAFNRRIALYARKDALGELPTEFAELLRRTLETDFLDPVRAPLSYIPQAESFEILR